MWLSVLRKISLNLLSPRGKKILLSFQTNSQMTTLPAVTKKEFHLTFKLAYKYILQQKG